MKTKSYRDHSKWIELISSRYDDQFVFYFKKLQDQMTLLLGECPAKDLFNESLNVWASQIQLQPVSAMLISIEHTYGVNIDTIDFKRKHPEITKSMIDLRNILINVHFMIGSNDIFEELNKVPIQYN